MIALVQRGMAPYPHRPPAPATAEASGQSEWSWGTVISMKIPLNAEGKRFLEKRLGVQLREAYFRVRSSTSKRKYLRIEAVLRTVNERDAEKVKVLLAQHEIKNSQEARGTVIVSGNYNVGMFIDKLGIIQYLPGEIRNLVEKYTPSTRKILYIKDRIDENIVKVIEGLVNIELKITGGGYPQLILAYGTRQQALQALNILSEEHEIHASLQPGERSRTIIVYRIADVHYLSQRLLDKNKLPEKFVEALERTMLSQYSRHVKCSSYIASPSLWRILGLILGDNYNNLNSIANTNPEIIKLFVEKAIETFGEEVLYNISLNIKLSKRKNRKPIFSVLLKGNVGKCVKKLAENVEKSHTEYLLDVDKALFWEFITGLYEADGCVSVRYPSKKYRKPYPEVSIRLSLDQEKLAEQITKRLNKEGVKARLKRHSNTWEIRMTSIDSFREFFKHVSPIIKNPADPRSFVGTRTKPENIDKIYEIYKKLFSLFS